MNDATTGAETDADVLAISKAQTAILNIIEALERELGRQTDYVRFDRTGHEMSVEIAMTRRAQ